MEISLFFESQRESGEKARRTAAVKAPPQSPNEFRAECTRKYMRIESEQRLEAPTASPMLSTGLSDGHAAVDAINVAGREGRLVRGEEHDDRRDLLRCGEPAHRLPRDERLARLGGIGESIDALAERRRVDRARRDRVAADAAADEVR